MARYTCVFDCEELKKARKAIGISAVEMSRVLKTPLRTYQDWEAGVNRIPGVVEVAVTLYQERDRWVMAKVFEGIERSVEADIQAGVRW